MKQILKKIFIVSIVFIELLFSKSLIAEQADLYEEKNAQLTGVNRQIAQLQKELQQSRNQKEILDKELQQIELEISKSSVDLSNAKQERTITEQEITQLQQKTSRQQQQIKQQQKYLVDQVRAAYLLGNNNTAKLLLNQQDPKQVNRLLTYYGYINLARAELVATLTDFMTELNETQAATETQSQQLNRLMVQIQGQQQELGQQQSYRQAIVEALNKQVASDDEVLQGLLNNKKELEQLIQSLSLPQGLNIDKPFAKMQKQLPWPLKGEIAVAYGQKISQSSMTYSGVFITAPAGETVQAIYPGQVVFANWMKGYGLLLILDHGDGYMSLYAHNQSLYQQEGDQIGAGSVIATVGNSGGNRKDGLYFEIRHDGRSINPSDWCT
ncbi:MAG: peptidoglycan DD-metalloendopeptidase family protein [Gammaproteobacteria bacterium]